MKHYFYGYFKLIENALKYSEDEVNCKISQNSIDIIDKGIGIEEKS